MRDAFGGVFMIRMMLVILFIYVSFSAVSLNYAKAFRVKNSVIDLIEQSDLRSLDDIAKRSSFETNLSSRLSKLNYNKECVKTGIITDENTNKPYVYCYGGVAISVESQDSKYIYYKVTTVADWNLGPLTNLLSFTTESNYDEKESVHGNWKITGTAKVAKK